MTLSRMSRLRRSFASLCLGLALCFAGRRRAAGRRAAEGRLRLCRPGRRRRLVVPARPGPQGAGKGASGRRSKPPTSKAWRDGADAERVIRRLAASGNSLIFTTSFGYMEPTLKVAKQFPKVHFEHATGLQDRRERLRVRSALLRRRVHARRARGQDDQDQHARLHRLASDSGSDPQHQCVHARRAQRESQGADQSDLGGYLVRPRQGTPGRGDADRARRGRPQSEHRFARRRASRTGKGQVRVRLGFGPGRSTGRRRTSPPTPRTGRSITSM